MKKRKPRANLKSLQLEQTVTETSYTTTNWTGLDPKPDSYFGFCYLVTNLLDGRMYIGKKQYWKASGKVRNRPTDKCNGKWKSHHWVESDWKTYTTSSKEVNKDINTFGIGCFMFEIISQHCSKSSLHYNEIKWQVEYDVLRARDESGERLFYNRQIGAVKFLPPVECSQETREKLSMSRRGVLHHFYGKQHPNKGKKLPQTSPKTHVSTHNIQITDGTINKWWPRDAPLPEGFSPGFHKSRHEVSEKELLGKRRSGKERHEKYRTAYENSPNYCLECGLALSYGERHKKLHEECYKSYRAKFGGKISASLLARSREDVLSASIAKSKKIRLGIAINAGFNTVPELVFAIHECRRNGDSYKKLAFRFSCSVCFIQNVLKLDLDNDLSEDWK